MKLFRRFAVLAAGMLLGLALWTGPSGAGEAPWMPEYSPDDPIVGYGEPDGPGGAPMLIYSGRVPIGRMVLQVVIPSNRSPFLLFLYRTSPALVRPAWQN